MANLMVNSNLMVNDNLRMINEKDFHNFMNNQ
jgi:hypothetical protein